KSSIVISPSQGNERFDSLNFKYQLDILKNESLTRYLHQARKESQEVVKFKLTLSLEEGILCSSMDSLREDLIDNREAMQNLLSLVKEDLEPNTGDRVGMKVEGIADGVDHVRDLFLFKYYQKIYGSSLDTQHLQRLPTAREVEKAPEKAVDLYSFIHCKPTQILRCIVYLK
ncbi:MAG: hypothetical protein AAFR59_19735, partial [Bacteroidota bacterium]